MRDDDPPARQFEGAEALFDLGLTAAAMEPDVIRACRVVVSAEAAASHPEFDGQSVSVAAFFSGQWGAYVAKDLRVQFMEQLGFVNSEAIEALDTGSFYVELSPESLDVLDAALTVAFPLLVEDVATIEADPLFNAVPSVAAGNVVVLDDADLIAAFSAGSASALLYAIEHAVPLFSAAVAQ